MKLSEIILGLALFGAVASLALPSHLQSRRWAREREAARSIYAIFNADDDFRINDRDRNGVADYWTADVYGLFGLIPIGTSTPLRLIDPSIAAADGLTQLNLYGNLEFGRAIGYGRLESGYVFRALHNVEGRSLLNDTDGARRGYGRCHDEDQHAFIAFPISLASGKLMFLTFGDRQIWKYYLPSNYSATFTGASGISIDSTSTTSGPELAPDVTLTALPGKGNFAGFPAAIGCCKLCD